MNSTLLINFAKDEKEKLKKYCERKNTAMSAFVRKIILREIRIKMEAIEQELDFDVEAPEEEAK